VGPFLGRENLGVEDLAILKLKLNILADEIVRTFAGSSSYCLTTLTFHVVDDDLCLSREFTGLALADLSQSLLSI